jgi:hypothetical protein
MATVEILSGGTNGRVLVTFRLAQTVRPADMEGRLCGRHVKPISTDPMLGPTVALVMMSVEPRHDLGFLFWSVATGRVRCALRCMKFLASVHRLGEPAAGKLINARPVRKIA